MKSELMQLKFLLSLLYLCIVVAVVFVGVVTISPSKSVPRILLGGTQVSVAIADTPALQEKGLSGVQGLKESEGMLFVFPNPSRVGFWMKEMLFPIDIIWFDASRRIVDVWENATSESYPEIHAPRADAQYVVEVQAGFYKKHNLKLGDVLELESSARYTK